MEEIRGADRCQFVLPLWALILIIVASVLIVAGGAYAYLRYYRKKQEESHSAEVENAVELSETHSVHDKDYSSETPSSAPGYDSTPDTGPSDWNSSSWGETVDPPSY